MPIICRKKNRYYPYIKPRRFYFISPFYTIVFIYLKETEIPRAQIQKI